MATSPDRRSTSAAGTRLFHQRLELGGEDALHTLRRLSVGGAGPQQDHQRLVALPTFEEVADQRSAHLPAIQFGEVGKPQVELRRGGEQLVFAAEIPHHHRRVYPGVGGDAADRGGLKTVRAESLSRRGQDGGLGLLRRSSHVNDCRPTSVDIRNRPAHDGQCQQVLTFTEEDHHDRHRRPGCGSGPDRAHTGRVAAASRCRTSSSSTGLPRAPTLPVRPRSTPARSRCWKTSTFRAEWSSRGLSPRGSPCDRGRAR